MSAAENLTKLWAAKRLDVPVSKIESVEFVDEPEYRYSSWTIEPATQGANITFTEPVEIGQPPWAETTMLTYIDTTDTSFGDLLAELLG